MQRDMDLVRKILLKAEEDLPSNSSEAYVMAIDGYEHFIVQYHTELLIEAGLMKSVYSSDYVWSMKGIYPERLTWKGHEFLESARNEKWWNKAKNLITEKGGGMTFDILKSVLIAYAKDAVNL